MEFVTAEVPLNFRLVDTGDWHVGPHGFDEKALDEILYEIKQDKSARMILKGDLIDAITTDDKRYSAYSQDITKGWRTADDHLDYLIDRLKPHRKQIITALMGNHELTLLKQTDLIGRLCKALQIPWGGYTCVVTFRNKSRNKHLFKALVTHGRVGISSQAKDDIQALANMKATLKKNLSKLKFYDCIYQSMGHAHKILIAGPTVNQNVILTTTPKGLKQHYRSEVPQNATEISPDARYYVCSGSLLKTFATPGNLSYAEFAQYGPVEIGCVNAIVKDGEIVDVVKRVY